MSAKMRSLVSQLCRGMPRPVALIVVGLLPTRVRSVRVVALLMEAALQAYLTSIGLDAAAGVDLHAPVATAGGGESTLPLDFVAEPMGVIGAAIASSAGDVTLESLLHECANHTPLSLRMLHALQVLSVGGETPMGWMPAAIACVRSAAACRVHPAREFELLPLWFHVIELVADERWLLEYSIATEAITAFTRALQTACGLLSASALALQGSLWDSFGKEPPPLLQTAAMQLAARALLLYLAHALDAKARNALARTPTVAVDLSQGGPEPRAQATALLKCAQQPAFRLGFEAFFNVVQALSSRPGAVPIAEFKREIVRTLLPMAPYLCGL